MLFVDKQLDGAPYAVLELVPGEDLQRMLRRQGLCFFGAGKGRERGSDATETESETRTQIQRLWHQSGCNVERVTFEGKLGK